MQPEEFKLIDAVFKQGIAKLEQIKVCIQNLVERESFDLLLEDINKKEGELRFWYAGSQYYVHVRITDRDVDDMEPGYRVPLGWLDWGRYSSSTTREQPEFSSFYDDKGILCKLNRDDYFWTLSNCDDANTHAILLTNLQRLATKTLAVNNVAG